MVHSHCDILKDLNTSIVPVISLFIVLVPVIFVFVLVLVSLLVSGVSLVSVEVTDGMPLHIFFYCT